MSPAIGPSASRLDVKAALGQSDGWELATPVAETEAHTPPPAQPSSSPRMPNHPTLANRPSADRWKRDCETAQSHREMHVCAPPMSATTTEAAGEPPTVAASRPDMNEVIDLFPVPTLVVSPLNCIQSVSQGLLSEWEREEAEFTDQNLFSALYRTSPTQRFDRISLTYTIETAVAARAPRLCHAAYAHDNKLWSARVVPVFRKAELLCLVIEWEKVLLPMGHTDGDISHSWLSVDEAFRILVQAVKDYAIFLLDTRGNVATWNTGAELLKGYRRDEVVGKHFSIFYGEEDLRAGKPERKLETCLREGRIEDQGWRYRKDGTRFWASVVITAVYRNGVHVGFGKVTRDLTEWKQAELRLIAAYEESTKLKNDFLANMSHEIRTPLHGMLSACSLLLDTSLTKDQRETASIIEDSGSVLRQVINDILDYSKLASGGFSVNSDTMSVPDILSSVSRSVQTTLQPGVTLGLDLAPNLPKSAQGDPLRLRQVVQNIVGNAAKFTEKGTISLRAFVTSEDEDSYTVQTEVSDTGPGVSGEDAIHLFQPFTQVDTTIMKRYKGTGLGLSIAKSLTELMGGNIGYRPKDEGLGSVFWFSVRLGKTKSPLANGAEEPEGGARKSISSDSEPTERLRELAPTKRILAAEDNPTNQRVLTRILQSFGFKDITMVSDGAQAVSEVGGAEEPYDLVLMDISMPIMDGFKATAEIKRLGIRPPIVAMTAYALKGDRERCMTCGMDDYVPKPVNRVFLASKLLKWLLPPHGEESAAHGGSSEVPGEK